MVEKTKKRILADFYKKMFDKHWAQKVDTKIKWHHPSGVDDSSVLSFDAITSQSNLGPM